MALSFRFIGAIEKKVIIKRLYLDHPNTFWLQQGTYFDLFSFKL